MLDLRIQGHGVEATLVVWRYQFWFLFVSTFITRPGECAHTGLIMATRYVAWPMPQNYPFETAKCQTIDILIASKQ